jgi:hypothetical protein
MRSMFTIAFLLFAATGLTGCGTLFASAGVESRPGDYHVNGYTSDPIGAIAVSSQAYVDQYNAETYRRCVEGGRCYGYPGGGMYNDYWFNYRGVVPPQQVVAPAPPPSAVPPSTASPTGGPVSQGQLDEVRGIATDARGRADAALRMHARLRDRMRADAQADQTPTPESH